MKKVFVLITSFFFISGHLLLFLIGKYYLNIDYFYLIVLTFFLLSASASWLIAWRDNLLIRIIYFISGIWGGIILNSLLLFLIFYFLNLQQYIDNLVFWFFICLIPLLIYEFLAAYLIKTRKITVYIKDLPSYWENKKIVHFSDLHLGPVWRMNFYEKLVKKINRLKPSAVFITGDLFDGMEADFSWLHIEEFKIKAPDGVYYSFGNHDEILGSKQVNKLLGRNGIKVLENEMLEKNGLQIIGLNSFHHLDYDIKNTVLKQFDSISSKPSILLLHEPISLDKIRSIGVNLQLSGHSHGGQMFPFNLVNKLLYSGHDYGLFKKDNFYLNVSSGAGTWGPPLRLFTRSEIVQITLKKNNNI